MPPQVPKQLKFSTKARTLEALGQLLREGRVPESFHFSVKSWRRDGQSIIESIQAKFSPNSVIARSSALVEDGVNASMAGAFTSVNGVDSSNAELIRGAVDSVIESYGDSCRDADEVLIQEVISDISMSGVIFTHDLNTGAPYYVINYDDESGRTDTVTAGSTDKARTLLVHRNHVDRVASPRFTALLAATIDVETRSPFQGLDIEFAVTVDEVVYILQVRPLAVQSNWNRHIASHIDQSLEEIDAFVSRRLRKCTGALGDSSLLGEMPDWNPAELIGAVPRPLARSLFEYLITDSVWAEARAKIGYRDLSGRPLMVTLGGRVFIDVRESFNSMLPASLSDETGEKLASAWIDRLRHEPHLHDKVELEVAVTAYTPDFSSRMQDYADYLSSLDVDALRTALKNLTDGIVSGKKVAISSQIQRINSLDRSRKQAISEQSSCHPLAIVRRLLIDCRANGTLPFSILARYAFIAEDFLRAFETVDGVSSESLRMFRGSIRTVLTDFIEAVEGFLCGEISEDQFANTYGHLRPGTYDILALRYDQRDQLRLQNGGRPDRQHHVSSFVFPEDEIAAGNRALASLGLSFDFATLLAFCKDAIAAREYAKLVYTRNISDALELIAEWGHGIGLSREELSFLDLREILRAETSTSHQPSEEHFRSLAVANRQAFDISKSLRLPYLIRDLSDLYVVPLLRSRANFITQKRIHAPLLKLSGQEIQSVLPAGHIVVVERADPGYDWIFLTRIAGLVTKYGGANSHMAIRCAELGIPAAIGCGEQLYERLLDAEVALLDCGSGILAPE